MSDAPTALEKARRERSRRKRRAVEEAIHALVREGQPVTFLAVSKRADVSRQYLYSNFRTEIGGQREHLRDNRKLIDGRVVPLRTMDHYRHLEAVLRNKLHRVEDEAKALRAKLREITTALERERGLVEYWREQYEAALIRRGAER